MATYLVDVENTAGRWNMCQESMRAGDKIILFYTGACKTLNFEQFDSLSGLNIPVQFVKCTNGSPNALDFQLLSYLGYLISQNPDEQYYIIANDNGYDAAVAFWQSRGVDILRVMFVQPNCREIISGESGVTAVRSDIFAKFMDLKAVKLQFERLLPDAYQAEIYTIFDLFETVLHTVKRNYRAISFRNNLTRVYGLSKGSEIYDILKPCATSFLKSAPDALNRSQSAAEARSDAAVSFYLDGLKTSQSGSQGDSEHVSSACAAVTSDSSAAKPLKPKIKTWSWAAFSNYVNTQKSCSVYGNSLCRDFAHIDAKLARQIMAVMAYARLWVEKSRQIEIAMCVIGHSLPANMPKAEKSALRRRLNRKLATGAWPACLDEKIQVSDPPLGFSKKH